MGRARDRRDENDLVVTVRLEISAGVPVEEAALRQWLSGWQSRYAIWRREWFGAGGAVVRTDVLRFVDFFAADFELSVHQDDPRATTIEIRAVIGTRDRAWRDWLALLLHDFRQAWPQARFVGLRQVD